MIIALAGRRVDAIGAKQIRFSPEPENIERVRKRLHAMFLSNSAIALVSSAACGADLLALEEAGRLGLRRRVILPFSPARFRSTSVIDRPGNWGPLYDTTIKDVDSQGDLMVLASASETEAFVETNHAIIEEAIALGENLQCPVSAVRVWDGTARGAGDLTEEFGHYAKKRGIPLIQDVFTV
ncbi:MAG TPA: hypothetical protein VGI45_01795 [Terracidiphilus sp.]|jgi:hypothetical protein